MAETVEHEVHENFGALLRALGRIALVLVEVRDQFLLPCGADATGARAGALLRRDRTLRLRRMFDARHRGRLRGHRFLRGRRLHRRLLRIVIHRLLRLVFGDDPIRVLGLRRRVLGQIGLLHDRLLLGKRGRSDGRVGVGSGRKVGRLAMRRSQIEPDLDRRRAEIVFGLVGLHVSHRQRHATDVNRERSDR